MPAKSKKCSHPDCTTMITYRNTHCRAHVNWRAVSKTPTSYSVMRNCIKCGERFRIRHSVQRLCDECRTYNCVVCGAMFSGGGSETVTCSKECSERLNSAPQIVCKFCGITFKQKRGHVHQYCSKQCKYLASRKNVRETALNRHQSHKYRNWRKQVLKRDDYKCQHCGATEKLHAHHIKEWERYPELAYDVDNGLTLCQPCHSIVHGGKPITERGGKRLTCERCGVRIGGRGKSPYCRSCAMKLSDKVKQSRASRKRDTDGQFN